MHTLPTMQGMIVVVAAVILMSSVGRGTQLRVNQAIASRGNNLFIILTGTQTTG